MLLHFKFAILLATQEIMFVNSGKFSLSELFRPSRSQTKHTKSKATTVDLTDLITGPEPKSKPLENSSDPFEDTTFNAPSRDQTQQPRSKPAAKPNQMQKLSERTTTNSAPFIVRPQEPFGEMPTNILQLFRSGLHQQSPDEQRNEPTAESQTNVSGLSGLGSQRPPDKNDTPPRTDPVHKSIPQKPSCRRSRIGPVAGTMQPKVNKNGRQIKSKKNDAYKAVDYAEIRSDMRERHDYFRRKHGIQLLEVDSRLNESAQKYANILAKTDPRNKQKHSNWPYVGENIFYISRRLNRMGLVSVNLWWAELEYCTINETPKSLVEKMHRKKTIGHLLQLLWTRSTNVGFGIARSRSGAYYIVAHYSPEGNVIMLDRQSGDIIGVVTKSLPLPFLQHHIDEATILNRSIIETLDKGLISSSTSTPKTSEEWAQDLDTIDDYDD